MGAVASIRAFGPDGVLPEALDDMVRVLHHRGRMAPVISRSARVHLASLPHFVQAGEGEPLVSRGGRWVAALDGLVVNGRRLKSEFRLHADSNDTAGLLLEGLTVAGISFTERLEGQFAVVAHDLRRGRTYLVRDRIGIQPLYYARTPSSVLIASEVKAILTGLGGSPGLDEQALGEYLAHGTVSAPRTMFLGVRAVEPGTRVEIGPQGIDRTLRYWTPPDPDPDTWWAVEDAIDTVDTGLRESIRGTLGPGHSVGACLSRGIDSNLVAHVLASETDHPIHTFSARIAGQEDTASTVPDAVSRAIGATHHAVPIGPTDLSDWWQTLSWHRDAPLTNATDIAVYLVSRAARSHVDLLLTGEGGDELFGGYRKYRLARAAQALDAVPASVRARLAQSLTPVFGHTSAGQAGLRFAGARDDRQRLEEWGASFSPAECAALLGRSQPLHVGHSRLPGAQTGDLIARMQRHDLGSWLPAARLERDDRMAMAASFMLRPALLDDRLVHASLRIPSAMKVRHGQTKWVLKEVARRYLPDSIVDRPRVGFRIPLGDWLRGPLRDEVQERLTGSGSFVSQTMDPRAVGRILARHNTGHHDESGRLWALLALDVWHETLIGAARGAVRT